MRVITRDFIALFNAFWYRDFPVAHRHKQFGSRAEWTTHIGICVRSCADLLGFFTHFEAGNRTDAVIRDNTNSDVIHAEWEWKEPRRNGVNEIEKLRSTAGAAKLSVLITYSNFEHYDENLASIRRQWEVGGHECPLLVLLVTFRKEGGRSRQFMNLETHHAQRGSFKKVRSQPALPWRRSRTRWEVSEFISVDGES